VGCLSYKLYRLFQTQHSFSVTIFTLGFRLFFILLQINLSLFSSMRTIFTFRFFYSAENKQCPITHLCAKSGVTSTGGFSTSVMPPSQNEISKQMMKKWEQWETSIQNSRNPRMLQQLTLHSQQIIKTTSTQDLDPRPLGNNDHPSILPFECIPSSLVKLRPGF
jgi:hypothetical protein